MTSMPESDDELGETLAVGSKHYRAWVGPPYLYDCIASMQFVLLALLGLREHHRVLDIGCGSLRAGRLLIMYLRSEKYYGIDPIEWAVRDGIQINLGDDLLARKKPSFSFDDNFTLTSFRTKFDFLLAQSVFSHASISQISRCLEQSRQVMHNKSVFAATFVEGDTDHGGSEWVYPNCVSYTPCTISRLVRDAGLECTFIDWPHPNGQRWFIATDPSYSFDWTALRAGSTFSKVTHLKELVEQYVGTVRTYDEYLREDLLQYVKDSR